ncbi:MAG: hypothetical protein ABJF11_19570 [Reichenbachiella sp.]|uniref:hypothetical protein n=1 Tax=Reichenbachiella sp. TaxID=2184521 RepID=UPI0032656FD4
MISVFKYLLWPLAWCNGLRILLRNRLFDLQIWKSVEFEIPVIFVGSFSPQPTLGITRYMSELLGATVHIKQRSLSGYRMKTVKGEAFYYDLVDHGTIFIAKHKILGLSEWIQLHPETPAIVMDQEFSRIEIRPSISIYISDFNNPFYKDNLWPVGTRNGLIREVLDADVVIIFGTPPKSNLDDIVAEHRLYLAPQTKVYFISNTREQLQADNLGDKIEFITDRDNFAPLIKNLLLNANPDSE